MDDTLSPLYKSWLALRSGIFFAGYAVITVFFSLTGMLFLWYLPFRVRGRYFVIGNQLIVWLLRVVCGVRTKVIGSLPEQGPYVALSKHQSQWETFYLQWYLFPVTTVLKKELLSIPFFGWALRLMNAIGIDRSNPRAALRQTMEQGCDRLSRGYSVLIFPEGTRVKHGEVGKYARSGAGMAIKAEVPIVALAHNAGKCWPAKSLLIRPGTVTLSISPPFDSRGRDVKELNNDVAQWIEHQCQQIG
ncbi:MAG: lysophospholipid acyltransferase family protein [Spongiibacter sp.]